MPRHAQFGLATVIVMSSSATPAFAASAATGTGGGSAWSVALVVLIFIVVALLVAVIVLLLNPQSGGQATPAQAVARVSEPEPDVLAESSQDADDPAVSVGANVGKRNAVSIAIVAVFIIGAVIVVGQTTKPTVNEGLITRKFTAAEPCVTALIPIAVDPSTDPRKAAETIFSALAPVRGLTSGTYNIDARSLEIGFCESETSEAAIREAIAPTGLLGQDGGSSETTP
ncbi:MAG: hypothetical protein D9V44_06925 [Actinobacteria bacterium]|nr:MAG: hypothetical protein D9V44_06925 [Actinomycetota bacterium]